MIGDLLAFIGCVAVGFLAALFILREHRSGEVVPCECLCGCLSPTRAGGPCVLCRDGYHVDLDDDGQVELEDVG